MLRLDEAMRGPLGGIVEWGFQLTRQKKAGFPMAIDGLPSLAVSAVEILWEEEQDFIDERRGRDEEAESVKRELGKRR
jgi:hypothetical protein